MYKKKRKEKIQLVGLDNCVFDQDGSSEPSCENWEWGKEVFLALNKHYKT